MGYKVPFRLPSSNRVDTAPLEAPICLPDSTPVRHKHSLHNIHENILHIYDGVSVQILSHSVCRLGERPPVVCILFTVCECVCAKGANGVVCFSSRERTLQHPSENSIMCIRRMNIYTFPGPCAHTPLHSPLAFCK